MMKLAKKFKAAARRRLRSMGNPLRRRLVIGSVVCAGLIAAFVSAIALIRIFDTVGWAANELLVNASTPSDDELPPTAHAIPYASADIQLIGGQGDGLGCSIDGLASLAFRRRGNQAPISLRMRQACVFHDYCYRHGAATYGYGQADCDYLLLEHAYRICRYINTSWTIDRCVTDARKVLLGVRFGGRNHFKRADQLPHGIGGDQPGCHENRKARLAKVSALLQEQLMDDCSSSYFEFNPYPVRSTSYTVYRIADAPKEWNDAGLLRKALYVFKIRPSGTQVIVIGWTQGAKKATRCTGYELPGVFAFLTTAPHVVKATAAGGESEDWFVWWRRHSLEKTSGHLAILAPRRAALANWALIFPGAGELRSFVPEECAGSPVVDASLNALNPPSATMMIGKEHDDDAKFSDLHFAPGLEPKYGLRLMALRTHSCPAEKQVLNKKENKLKITTIYPICYLDILVDPSAGSHRPLLPFVGRDEINRWVDDASIGTTPRAAENDGKEPDRYRNFVSPPFSIAGPSDPKKSDEVAPIFAWLRRGEARGQTYDKVALLRRAHGNHVLGVLKLLKFDEGAEPIFVIDRTRHPSLGSIRAHHGAVLMHQWQSPQLSSSIAPSPKLPTNAKCWEVKDDDRVSLNACAEDEISRNDLATSCASKLNDTWLVRPPIVLPPANENIIAEIVFTRMLLGAAGDRAGVLQVTSAKLWKDRPCELSKLEDHPVGPVLNKRPPNGTPLWKRDDEKKRKSAVLKAQRIWENDTGPLLRTLRGRPVLVADLDQRDRYLIVPDLDKPWDSLFLPLR